MDSFTLDVILRLPLLATDGSSRMKALNTGRKWQHHHQQPLQQWQERIFVYDPLVCTRMQEEDGCSSSHRPGGTNSVRWRLLRSLSSV